MQGLKETDPEKRRSTVGTRMTPPERRLIQDAANASGQTLCAYIAGVALKAARSDLEAA
jgi:uncharacterized protein (DUF1778 family)